MIKFVPSVESFCFRSPLALSVKPTAPTIAATPTIGPSMISNVRILRAERPVHATPRRSRNRLIVSMCSRHGREALVGDDLAVAHRYFAARGARDGRVVRDHDDRALRRLETLEDVEHVGRVRRVERARGLV